MLTANCCVSRDAFSEEFLTQDNNVQRRRCMLNSFSVQSAKVRQISVQQGMSV